MRRCAHRSLYSHLSCWPHNTLKEALKKLYGFCSNYPGIRHGGNPNGQLRSLDEKDAILICLLLMAFSGYLTDEVNVQKILGVE